MGVVQLSPLFHSIYLSSCICLSFFSRPVHCDRFHRFFFHWTIHRTKGHFPCGYSKIYTINHCLTGPHIWPHIAYTYERECTYKHRWFNEHARKLAGMRNSRNCPIRSYTPIDPNMKKNINNHIKTDANDNNGKQFSKYS